MVRPVAGDVVTVTFPFSDLSSAKRRPAIVLADADRGDWIVCQITSKAGSDVRAVELSHADFDRGSLRATSYARPGKLFTVNESLMASYVGTLKQESFQRVWEAIVGFRPT